MRLATFSLGSDGGQRLGLEVEGSTIVELAAALDGAIDIPSNLFDYVAAPEHLHRQVSQHVRSIEKWPAHLCHLLDDVTLHAPLRPGKVVGVGLNYVEHVEESSRTLDTAKSLPERPVLFSKPSTAVIGPGEPIQHNSQMTNQLDWECELAVVIGRKARSVEERNALDYVFGYSIVNDISARDQRRSGQWFYSKGQDSYAPFGPVVVTTDEIGDPQSLRLSLDVNGDEHQNGSTANMLFNISALIADISRGMTLEPGDVIATGSPQGVGAAMTPPTYLLPGDVVSAHIEKIGTLTNPVKAV